MLNDSSTSNSWNSTNNVITTNLAGVVSSLLNTCTYYNDATALLQELLQVQSTGTIAGQTPTTISVPGLSLSLSQSDASTAGTATTVGSVTVPSSLIPQSSNTDVDTAAGATNAAVTAINTQVMQLGGALASCKHDSTFTGSLASGITNIDIYSSNGTAITSGFAEPIRFLLPLDLNVSELQSSINSAGTNSTCTSLYGNSNPPVEQPVSVADIAAGMSCGYWSPDGSTWDTSGCYSTGLTGDETSLQCECYHLTEFAILMQQGNTSCCDTCNSCTSSIHACIMYRAL